MTVALRQPGVYVEEVPSGVRTITGVATSIALFVGWAAKGPVDRAQRIASFSDYERVFGGLDQRTLLGHSVKHFFDNGGADAYILRLTVASDGSSGTLGAETARATIDPLNALTTSRLSVTASSPGDWGNHYRVRLTRRSATDSTPGNERFKIEVLRIVDPTHDVVVEVFENLSIDATDQRFVRNVINQRSTLIRVALSDNPTTPADDMQQLADGEDGNVLSPGTPDFHTALDAQFGTIIDQIDLFNLVCVPGETDPTTLAALQKHCRDRRAFLIIDTDPNATPDSFSAGVGSLLTGVDAPNSALFFPWVRAADPLYQGALGDFPPSGFVAGVFARTDSTRGVWKAPAGTEATLSGATELTITMSDAQNGNLNPLAINCLRTLPPYGNVVWGARTLDGQTDRGSEWKNVPVRRLALFLEESLYRGTQWVVFEPNDEPLWAQIRLNTGAFMNNLFRQGAFQGRTPREAYFVKCDRETTTQADIDLGVVNIHIGFAPLKPAEFVILRIQQIAGELAT
jgi:phage tail sheath protein FI